MAIVKAQDTDAFGKFDMYKTSWTYSQWGSMNNCFTVYIFLHAFIYYKRYYKFGN